MCKWWARKLLCPVLPHSDASDCFHQKRLFMSLKVCWVTVTDIYMSCVVWVYLNRYLPHSSTIHNHYMSQAPSLKTFQHCCPVSLEEEVTRLCVTKLVKELMHHLQTCCLLYAHSSMQLLGVNHKWKQLFPRISLYSGNTCFSSFRLAHSQTLYDF